MKDTAPKSYESFSKPISLQSFKEPYKDGDMEECARAFKFDLRINYVVEVDRGSESCCQRSKYLHVVIAAPIIKMLAMLSDTRVKMERR